MSRLATRHLGLAILWLVPGAAMAQHHGGGGGHSSGGGSMHPGTLPIHSMPIGPIGSAPTLPSRGAQLGAVAGGYLGYYYGGPYVVATPGYAVMFNPGLGTMGPAGYFGPPMPVRGPLLPPSPPGPRGPADPPAAPKPASDPDRAEHFLTFGDRLFRAGNLKRAEQRYIQARDAAPDRAAPHLRQAQIALVRGKFAEAADHLRDAETAEPGWILTAPDIQSIYGEPAEFLRLLARLESHVQSHPDDRDAWLVLGAEWFLSGRTRRAADVFLRLDDPNRKPDPALAAFLYASNQRAGAGKDAGGPR